jgi:hypothetical protein
VGITVMAACAPKPPQQIEALKTPQSPLQLVAAIWQLSDSGQILNSRLYTVDNLKRAFGGSAVDLKVGKSDVLIGSYWASIRDFPFGPSLQNHTSLSIDRLTLHPDGELRAKIRLDFERPFTDIDQTTIEKRFGRSWTEEEAVLPPHPIPMSIGRKITYQAGNDKSRANRFLRFSTRWNTWDHVCGSESSKAMTDSRTLAPTTLRKASDYIG